MLTFPVAYGRDNVTKTVKRMTSARRLVFTDDVLYRFSQALKRSWHFFSCTSQGHNALPRPGLKPGSSDSEPNALTTALLDKAVALACPWFSWPRMLKVAPCKVGRTVVSPNFFRLDGLLLPFCIIMGLRSASSAIMWQTHGQRRVI